MRPGILLLSLLLGLAAGPAIASDDETRLLAIDAALSIDPTGRLESVAVLRPELPEALRAAAEQQIRLLAFEPFVHDGVPARVASTAKFSACLRAEGDDFVLSMEPSSFGPLHANQVESPFRAVMRAIGPRQGEFGVTLRYTVHADGRASLDAMETRNVPKRALTEMERSYRAWIENHPFIPERVNGVAVATRMEMPLSVSMKRTLSSRPPKSSASPLCARGPESIEPGNAATLADDGPRLRLRPAPNS